MADECASCGPECCRVESVVSVDERGQFVLPKDVRTAMGLGAGEKLAIVSWRGEGGEVCCLTLIRADRVAEAVKGIVGPLMGGAGEGGE